MTTWIALIRGINVVGKKSVSMKELKRMLERRRCEDVQTYIQSGNVVFRSALATPRRVERLIVEAVAECSGFEPHVLALTRRELERAAAGNPYAEAEAAPKAVHLFFLAEAPGQPDLRGLEAVRIPSERYALKGKVLYLHTPDGFGGSKLAQRAERLLGVPATARNWRTVTSLVALAAAHGKR
jgi:uncharacterized protein (DUF1697 family)